MNQYKWAFPALEAYPQHEGAANVVFTVHWRLDGDDGQGHTAGTYGSIGVSYQADEPFTPFEQLTESLVQSWVESALGAAQVDSLKATIDAQIAALQAPQSVVLTPPWVQTEAQPVAE